MDAIQPHSDAEDDSSLWTSFDIRPPQEPKPPSVPPPPAPAFVPPLPAGPPPQQRSVLHHEIVALVKRLELTPQEVQQRQEAVGIMRDVAREIWPYAQVIMFGSSATGLAHCGSDLDLVVCGSENRRSRMPPVREWLSAMKVCLRNWQLCSKVESVPNAKVPIVKCVLYPSNLAVDIAFFVMNGPNAVPFIQQQVQTYAPLRDLCLVLKCLLGQNGLQEVYTGGIGSYCLLNMIVAHLQKTDPASQHDLGVLLLGFLRRYDVQHNYATDVVAIKPGIRRNKFTRNWVSPQDPNLLSVEDPQNPSQDIGKASFRIDDVRALFSRVRFALEAHWNRPGLIREVIDIDRDRMHLADGPVLHKGNRKRKQGHLSWQGAPGGPAEPPPNKRRKQNVSTANQNATPLPPVAAKRQKDAKNGGLQSVWDLPSYNDSLLNSREQPVKRSAVDRGAVETRLTPVKGAGKLDTWLSSGRAESSPGIGVLRDGIGGGTAVRFAPGQGKGWSGPGGSGVNGHQVPSVGGVSSRAGLEGEVGVSGDGVDIAGSNTLTFAGAIRRACEATVAGGYGPGASLNASAASAHPTEKLTRGLVRNGGSPNPEVTLNGAREVCRSGNAAGGWKKLDQDGEGFVPHPLDGDSEGWVDRLAPGSRVPSGRKSELTEPESKATQSWWAEDGGGEDEDKTRRRIPGRGTGSHEISMASREASEGEPWPGATVEPPMNEGPLRLPLPVDVMPASENRVTDETVWERVMNGYGIPLPQEEAIAALRAQRKRFLQRDATAQALVELKLHPYAPRVREGFCQLARIMIQGDDEMGGVPAKAKEWVRAWKEVSKKLCEGRTPVGGSPVAWLPKPIGELDETQSKVLRRAVLKLAGGDGQDEATGGHVAAGEGPQGGADVSGEAGSSKKARKKRKLEVRNLVESGGVNGDARGAGGQSTGVNGPLLPTWQSQNGQKEPTGSGAGPDVHGQGGNGFGMNEHRGPAGRLDESVERQHLVSGVEYASGVNGIMISGRGAVEGGVNGGGVTGMSAHWGDGHPGSAARGAVNGGSQHWGAGTGVGVNANGVNGGIEHRGGMNGDSVNGGGVANWRSEPGHERQHLLGGDSTPNGNLNNSWGRSWGWQGTRGSPPGYEESWGGPDTRYANPENHLGSGPTDSPFVFSATGPSDADVGAGPGVNQGRLDGNLPAGFAQATGSDSVVPNYANGFGGRAGTGTHEASRRRGGRYRGRARGAPPMSLPGGSAGQVPAFRGRSVVNVGQHVVGDALRY